MKAVKWDIKFTVWEERNESKHFFISFYLYFLSSMQVAVIPK